MKSIYHFILKYHLVLIFLILEIFAFSLIYNNTYYQRAKILDYSRAFSGVFYKRVNSFREYFILKELNTKLSEENARLKNSLLSSYELKRVDFLEVKDSIYQQHYFHIPAEVINNSTNKQQNYITLNRGSLQGVEPEMAVISPDGIVGVVNNVSKNYSTVISLLNKKLRISAKLKRNNYFGSLYWEGTNYRKVVLKEIPRHVQLSIGDTIVTSSFSAIFPEGIMIGTIEDFEMEGGNFYEIDVLLSTDFKSLTHVNVVKNLMKQERVTLENLLEND